MLSVVQQQVLRAQAEFLGSDSKGSGTGLGLGNERFIQAHSLFGSLCTARNAGEHVGGRALAGNTLRQAKQRFRGNGKRQRTARLRFGAMSLVDCPIADGRQQAAIEADIPEQQAMVRYHHIATLGFLARAMHEAAAPEERALVAQALGALRGNAPTRDGAVIDFQGIHVIVVALLHEREQASQRRSLVDLLFLVDDDLGALLVQLVHLAQAGVMGEALQWRIGYAHGARQQRKLLVHQLIQQRIRLRCHAYGNRVLLRGVRQGNQVRHRLANARAGFHRKVSPLGKGAVHGKRHFTLLFAGLVFVVERIQQPTGVERGGDLFIGSEL